MRLFGWFRGHSVKNRMAHIEREHLKRIMEFQTYQERNDKKIEELTQLLGTIRSDIEYFRKLTSASIQVLEHTVDQKDHEIIRLGYANNLENRKRLKKTHELAVTLPLSQELWVKRGGKR